MSTQTPSRPKRLEPALQALLSQLRRRIRAYVWAESVATALVVLGCGFWFSLIFDWLFEPPAPLRAVVLAVVGGALAVVIYRLLLRRVFVKLDDRHMALLLERRFGQFRDSLLTAVELTERPDHAVDFDREMLARTHRDALASADQVDVSAVFNTRPLVLRISLAVALAVAAAVFALALPSAAGVWARRTLTFSDELWPRQTRLVLEGFDREGRVKIARGSDWQLTVKADAALGRLIPEVVEVRYLSTEGTRGRENMSRDGMIEPGQAPFQPYTYTFKSVLAPLDFYVVGGDDRAGPFHLDVVDSPTIARMTLKCVYPDYMHREPREVPVAGLVQLPRGTQVTIAAQANKPLVAVQIDDVADEGSPTTHQIDLAQEQGEPQASFQFDLAQLDGDKTLLFTLRDVDGIRSREPVRLALNAVPDEPPQVNVQLKGIGTAITAQARLPAAGEVKDDYGVTRLWFDFHIDEAPPRQQPLTLAVNGQEQLEIADALDVRDLKLEPKQKLHYAVQAADGMSLAGGPNVGSSQRYVLDVVTPEQLRSMLEARELSLRRRFETIVEELTTTRNLLAEIAVGPPTAKAAEPKTETKDPAREPGDTKADEARAAEKKPTDNESPDAVTPRSTASLEVQVQRVTQNAQRSSHETLEVAAAFDGIREEMINNRVDTEELKTRLKDGVADPLRKIVAERFPRFETRLKELSERLADQAAAPTARGAALAEVDAILVDMRAVLDKMLELETFNEVLDMLRQIITSQEKLNTETKQKQKQKLRDLTE